ncbi:hypothetical protein [Sphingomonas sp. Leaf357]|uniref:hypothetical protein n=1 Tax=Sphingomonas sp. Leaf357 TaxID=1736350 RepID=UPI0012E1C623|nr:hypothetical protein [Sphingomonas sp. Leaf357]
MSSEIVAVCIGGGFALGGAYLGPWMQFRQKKSEHAREHNAMLREKGEELFALLANVRANAQDWTASFFISEQKKSYAITEFNKLHRMFAISAVYFPKSLVIFTDWRSRTDRTLDAIEKYGNFTAKQREAEITKVISKEANALCYQIENYLVEQMPKYL